MKIDSPSKRKVKNRFLAMRSTESGFICAVSQHIRTEIQKWKGQMEQFKEIGRDCFKKRKGKSA